MKTKTFATLFALAGIMPMTAQTANGYFFKEFTEGKVMLKNNQFAKGKFNYDCVSKEMHFLNGGTDMVVENLADIDTVAISDRRFIPYDDHFLEVMRGQKAVLFVDWKMQPKEMGKKGAMGTTTQGSVQAIDVNSRFQRVNGDQNLDLSVYKMETLNVYYLIMKGKWKAFRNPKTFIGLFPKEKQEAIRQFTDDHKLDLDQPEDILKVLDAFQ